VNTSVLHEGEWLDLRSGGLNKPTCCVFFWRLQETRADAQAFIKTKLSTSPGNQTPVDESGLSEIAIN
jgi:hypothetical protein